ncbi:MAG: threonine synthase [Deltaproteobacteria bacterium]|nr:MAG: threonine synthase [Deltaproteobacteria bacterium]
MRFHLACVTCDQTYDGLALRYRCDCGGTLDVVHDLDRLRGKLSTATFDSRKLSRERLDKSGVWRFRELILDVEPEHVVTKPEGNTNLYEAPKVASWVGLDALQLKHEGENPTGSFKDRGMTGGVTAAKRLGATRVACASTGNTSASMASYASQAGMEALVFIPDGKIAYGKLSQALAYGARTAQIAGDFDAAMALVQELCAAENIYLLNSVNPFRIEGQKAIGFEILQDLGWEVPDWIVLPGGNLGNNSALSKGLSELYALGFIDKLPRMAVIQAAGANPLAQAYAAGTEALSPVAAKTLATAIQIGNPVSWEKSWRGIRQLDGVVAQVSDQEILDAKAQVDAQGIGAEPASCATVAGIKKLVAEGVIAPDAHVVGILTGHLLKDPDIVVGYHQSTLEGFDSPYANAPTRIGATLADVKAWLEG